MAGALAECDLSEQRYHLLLAVAPAGPSGVVESALAEELHCPRSRVSLLVRELSDGGFIEGVRDATDRRMVRIRLTAAGRRLLDRAVRAQRRSLRAMASGLSRQDIAGMLNLAARAYLGLDIKLTVGPASH